MTLSAARRHRAEVRALIEENSREFRAAVEEAMREPPPRSRFVSYNEVREAQLAAETERELEVYGRVTISSPGMEPLDNDPSAWSALDAMRRGGQRDGKEVRR